MRNIFEIELVSPGARFWCLMLRRNDYISATTYVSFPGIAYMLPSVVTTRTPESRQNKATST